jgi:hypothetical protein
MQYNQLIEKESGGSISQGITFFEYLCVFVLIIYAGRANKFVEPFTFQDNLFGFLIPIVLSGILVLRWKVVFDKRFYLLILGFTIYFIAISLKYKDIRPTYFLTFFFIFFIVYSVVKALSFDLFRIFERLLFFLAIISLCIWSIQLALGSDTLFYLISNIKGIDLFSYVSGNGLSALIYSVQPSYSSLLYATIPRNCGYAWEPGAFAVYLCLAIFINLFFIDSDKKGRTRLIVLIIALLSTQSTTGYLIFVIMILSYLLNKRLKIVILLLPLVIISLVYVTTLPFMSKKVIELIDETKGIDQLVEESYGSEISFTPQRFTSFLIAFKDFQSNPILGVAGNIEETWTYKIQTNISTISGIGNLLQSFGLCGFFFFVILSYKTSVLFSNYFNYNGKFLFFLMILFISVSYSILFIPLIMCFWMFQLFESKDYSRKEVKNLDSSTINDGGRPY